MRTDPNDKGIYGLPMQLTVTAPIVNATLFEQAGVPLPGPKATWDEWAADAAKVAKATKTEAGMALDRSGHRFAASASHTERSISPRTERRHRSATASARSPSALRQLEQNRCDRTRGLGRHRRRQLPRRI